MSGLIDQAKEQGLLWEIEPLQPSWSVIRRIVATPDVYRLTTGGTWSEHEWKQWAESLDEWHERCAQLVQEFDHFLNGGLVTVALDPGTDGEECKLKRLHPSEDEIWTFRSWAPKPGIRVFGSFAITNTFLATNWALRKDLGPFGSKEWAAATEASRVIWQMLFGSTPRKSGQLHDYISRQAVSIDATP